ncbi:bifunctional phosphopantothenoylcysteine decarboxylase/phosphopantothenate--cysteine ligase CoaBC [Bombella sp. TMW 2.2543]|uniref:Coenzyme A biosynthesis bifunctional protein CoaBC n=1 Tax=Bombella pluederhausensis TaxID=2967336 RepID=A0ABT3WIP9_9PROT|nr:bifunctional phosphopantothenoylcysteine decarboxylase/phosphopantothenate--cysteine ligase CoaBC [Bombella pluederhausensis]MCX5617687.1 bifunctional phosphopantothenoylcysteine decarboxylase/phosphopantothenate--cysteine ligase CoaBC [Bombella pluederhausensis]
MARIILILSGSIAAYKALDVARELQRDGVEVIPVMTEAAQQFLTPLSLEVLCGQAVHTDLFRPGEESRIGHIALARSADMVLVCPSSADLMARMAQGMADDLATTILLATEAPIIVAPAMNPHMWSHPATQANYSLLRQRGVTFIGPVPGDVACGEKGTGRLAETENIVSSVRNLLSKRTDLSGKRIIVTAGPTVEPLDPVRFISNHSSGIQGYAVADALAQHGADVRLISGPVSLSPPANVTCIHVRTAEDMKAACLEQLPADAAICVAAVSDWRPDVAYASKMKKSGDGIPPVLKLVENPDILATLSRHDQRPTLVVGFAAETDDLRKHAEQKRLRKGCDWLLANDVTKHRFGGKRNQVLFLTGDETEAWPEMDKPSLAHRLADRVAQFFQARV